MPEEPTVDNSLSEAAIIAISLLLVLIDVVYSAIRSWTKRPDADNFLEYLVSRGSVIVLIAISRIVETLLPNIPLVYLTCLFYSAVSVAHIIDNAVKDNAPIPPPLAQAVRSLKNASGAADLTEPPKEKG